MRFRCPLCESAVDILPGQVEDFEAIVDLLEVWCCTLHFKPQPMQPETEEQRDR